MTGIFEQAFHRTQHVSPPSLHLHLATAANPSRERERERLLAITPFNLTPDDCRTGQNSVQTTYVTCSIIGFPHSRSSPLVARYSARPTTSPTPAGHQS
jgi:hypothetical protein